LVPVLDGVARRMAPATGEPMSAATETKRKPTPERTLCGMRKRVRGWLRRAEGADICEPKP